MDVTSFMGGNYLTQADLPAQPQAWTIRQVSQQLVGTDTKICLQFDQHPKPLGCNKTNLRAIALAYGTDSNAWIGRPLELYRDQTQFQGNVVPCIRVRVPQTAAPAAQAPTAPQPVPAQQPAATPQPQAAQAPWEQNDNSPPSA